MKASPAAVIVMATWLPLACSTGMSDHTPLDTVAMRYMTRFDTIEAPLSLDGRWVNGGSNGLDWTDVSTTPRGAIGHQIGASYTDGTALLMGAWHPNQAAMATVFADDSIPDVCLSEVELRLRSTMTPHDSRGYEVSYKVSQTPKAYMLIVRWNGPLGDFTSLKALYGAKYGVKNGDTIRATIWGNEIRAYKNGKLMARATDAMYSSGNPGVGFNLENSHAGCPGTNGRYGLSTFAAGDLATR